MKRTTSSLVAAVAVLSLGAGCSGGPLEPEPTPATEAPAAPGLPGVSGTPGAPGAAAPGKTPEQIVVDIARADEALKMADPDLFAVAQKYFPNTDPAGMTKRLFRLTRLQLDITTKFLLPEHYKSPAAGILPADPLETKYEYANNLLFNAANFTPYTNWVDEIAASVVQAPRTVIDCGETDAACADREARSFVTRAFRGVATDDTLNRFASFYQSSVGEVGQAQATADLVSVVLVSPSYVFRDEVLTRAGSATLLDAQLLQNVTYTLADSPPDALGWAAASAAQYVGSADQLQATIKTVLATPAAKDKLLRFFIAWLEVEDADKFRIDVGAFPEFTPEVAQAAVAETRTFLASQLRAAAPSLKSLTQSTESFVSEALETLYGPGTSGTGAVPLDPAQRLGLFTQPAVIASHSGPDTTRLVKRGVFFTRKVMCVELAAPPAGLDTTIPPAGGATERERVESASSKAECAGCHSFINPFGFVLENYDPIGRFRTTDAAGNPIDPSISISLLDEGPLATDSPVVALKAFTSSKRFSQCFSRQLMRFYLGRREVPSDDPLLRQLFFNFAAGDRQDIIELLQNLSGSARFSERTAGAAP